MNEFVDFFDYLIIGDEEVFFFNFLKVNMSGEYFLLRLIGSFFYGYCGSVNIDVSNLMFVIRMKY